MLIAERIKGDLLVPIDKNNPKTLEALSRIAQFGLKYLSWIESNRPKSIVTDIFRPDQYISQPGEGRNKLTLIDIEPRLKDRDLGVKFVNHEIGMLVEPLRDSEYDDTFCKYMHHALRALKQNRNYSEMAGLVNSIVNAPEIYKQMSDAFLAGKDYNLSQEVSERLRRTPLTITKKLLERFGIEKI
jgi:hypothetical protein